MATHFSTTHANATNAYNPHAKDKLHNTFKVNNFLQTIGPYADTHTNWSI